MGSDDEVSPTVSESYDHLYSLHGSMADLLDMQRSKDDPKIHEISFKVRNSSERFQIVRDRDWTQVIHPRLSRQTSDTRVPAQGPDHLHKDKFFVIAGKKQQEVITLQLCVQDAHITLTA